MSALPADVTPAVVAQAPAAQPAFIPASDALSEGEASDSDVEPADTAERGDSPLPLPAPLDAAMVDDTTEGRDTSGETAQSTVDAGPSAMAVEADAEDAAAAARSSSVVEKPVGLQHFPSPADEHMQNSLHTGSVLTGQPTQPTADASMAAAPSPAAPSTLSLYTPAFVPTVQPSHSSPMGETPPASRKKRFGDADTVLIESIPTAHPSLHVLPIPPPQLVSLESEGLHASSAFTGPRLTWSQEMLDLLFTCVREQKVRAEVAGAEFLTRNIVWSEVNERILSLEPQMTAAKCCERFTRAKKKKQLPSDLEGPPSKLGRPKKSAPAEAAATPVVTASEDIEDEDDEKDTSHSRAVAAAAAAAAHAAAFARRRMALIIQEAQSAEPSSSNSDLLTTDLTRLSFTVTHSSSAELESSVTDFVTQQLHDSDLVLVYCGAVMSRDCRELLELIHRQASAHSDLLFMVVMNQCKGSDEFNPQLWLLHAAPQQQWLLVTASVLEDGSSSIDREQRLLSSLHAALTEHDLDLLQLIAQANQHLMENSSHDDNCSWQVASNLRESLTLLPAPPPADPVPEETKSAPKKGRRSAAAAAEWSYSCCPCKARCDVEKCPCIKSMQLCVDCKPGIGYCANRDANRVATSDKRVRKQAKPDGEYLAALEAKPAAAHVPEAKPNQPKPSLAAAMMMHVKKTQPKLARPLVRVTPDSIFINRLLVEYHPLEPSSDAGSAFESGDADEPMTEQKDAEADASTAPAGRPCRHTCGCVKHGQTLHPRYVRGKVHREKHEHSADSHPNHSGSSCTFAMNGEASAPAASAAAASAAASSRPAASTSAPSPRSAIPPSPAAKIAATPPQQLKQIGLTDEPESTASQSKKRARGSSPNAPQEDAAPAADSKQLKTEQTNDVKARGDRVRIPVPGQKSNVVQPPSPANSAAAAAPPSVVTAVAAATSAAPASSHSAPPPPPSPAKPIVPPHLDNSARFFGGGAAVPTPIIKKANSPVAIKKPEPIVPQAATKSPTIASSSAPHANAAPTAASNPVPPPARAPPPAAAPIPRCMPSLTLPPKGDPMHFIIKKRILCPFLARCNFGDTCGYSHDVHTAARLRLPGERDEPVAMSANSPASSALPPIRPPVQAYMPTPPLHAVTFSRGDMKAQTCTTTGPLYGETSKHDSDVRYAIAAARCRRFKFCVQGRIPGAPPGSSAPSASEAIADAQRVVNFLKARGVLVAGQFDVWWAIRPPAGASAAGVEQMEVQLVPTGPSEHEPLNLVSQAADKLRGVDVTIRSLFTTADRQLLQQDEQELAQQTKRDLARRDETRNREQQRRTGPGARGRSRSRSRERNQQRDRMHENDRMLPRPTAHEPPPGISAANLVPLKARVPMFAAQPSPHQPPQTNAAVPFSPAPPPWNMHAPAPLIPAPAPTMSGATSLLGPRPMHAQPLQQPPQQPFVPSMPMQQSFGMNPMPLPTPAAPAPAPSPAPAVVSAAVSPPIHSVILQHGMCLCVFAGPATHDLNTEPLRSLLARRRILLDGFPIGPQYAALRSDSERLLDANDVIRQCTGSQWLTDQDRTAIDFVLRHRDSARVELQLSSEERRNECLAKKGLLERVMPGVRIWPAEQALVAPQAPAFNQQQPAPQLHQQQQQQQQLQQQQQQRPFHVPGAPQPPPSPPAAPPAYSFLTPLGGVPSNPSSTALYATYGTAPQDGSVLFDTANAPGAVFHPDGSETLMQPNADEMTRRADEVRRRQVLLCHLAPAVGWPFLPGPSGDAARLDDARTVFSLFSRAYSLAPGSTDLVVRYLVRLEDQRVVVQFASEAMLEDLGRRDPRALHELGWAIQRTTGTYLVAPAIVPPRATNVWANQPQPQQQQPMQMQTQQQPQQFVPFQQQQQQKTQQPMQAHMPPQQQQQQQQAGWSAASGASNSPNNFNSAIAPGQQQQQQRPSRFGPALQRPGWNQG